MIDAAQAARVVDSRALANELVATLNRRPFRPTAAQLAWVRGKDLISGREEEPLARIVAGRFAILFANHVIGDVAAKGAPGAYVRIVACARQAFLRSLPERGAGGAAGRSAARPATRRRARS